MVFHRCLFAAIFRKSGRNPIIDKLKGKFFYSFNTFSCDVIPIFLGQMKFGPEFGFFKGGKLLGYGVNKIFQSIIHPVL